MIGSMPVPPPGVAQGHGCSRPVPWDAPGAAIDLADLVALGLVVVVWGVVIVLAVLVLRAVCAEDLDQEHDQSND